MASQARLVSMAGLAVVALGPALAQAQPAAASEAPWLRLGGSYLFSSYQYEQVPSDPEGPLYRDPVAFGGEAAGRGALPQGFALTARAWVPTLPYLGFRGGFRSSFYGVTANTFAGEVVPDTLNVFEAGLLARLPVEVGPALLHVGARGGVQVEDFVYFSGDLDEGDVQSDPLLLPGVAAGGEVGAEIGPLWVVTGLTAHGLATLPEARGLTFDLMAGIEVLPQVTFDVGLAAIGRQAPVVGASGATHGRLSDTQVLGRAGIGLALGRVRAPVADVPARLLVTVEQEGAVQSEVMVKITDGTEVWEVRSRTEPVAVALPPGTYRVTASDPGYLADEEVVATPGDQVLLLPLEPLEAGTLSVSLEHGQAGSLETVGFSVLGDHDYTVTQTLGPDGLPHLDLPHGRYHLYLRAGDGTHFHKYIDIVAHQHLHVDAVLRDPRAKVTESRVEVTDRIYFETDSATIRPESFGLLEEIGALILANPQLQQLEIQGHTDSVGPEGHNIRLSQERAESVQAFLVDLGIEHERLTAEGYGPRFPIESNTTEEGRAANRRVDFLILVRE